MMDKPVWFQVEGDTYDNWEGVTWCDHLVNETDVCYVPMTEYKELEAKLARYDLFEARCATLTGSLWPKNETVEQLESYLFVLRENKDG